MIVKEQKALQIAEEAFNLKQEAYFHGYSKVEDMDGK